VPAKPALSDSVPPPPVVWAPAASSRGRFFQLRVSLLLSILVGVMLWAAADYQQRRARTNWQRTLNVALVLVEREPIQSSTIYLLNERVRELEQRLADEYQRHDGRELTPFAFTVTSPVLAVRAPPSMQRVGVLGLLRDTYDRWSWTRRIDARAGIAPSAYDARIYLVMKPANDGVAFVEGESEFGGRVGVAQVDIDPEMIDFSLFVATHELLHTLGASDKYDAQGRAVFPGGFAQPDKLPLFPQAGAEIMARNVPLAGGSERPPNTLSELFVGDLTARELGWRKP
jgi:hypothetical protein